MKLYIYKKTKPEGILNSDVQTGLIIMKEVSPGSKSGINFPRLEKSTSQVLTNRMNQP